MKIDTENYSQNKFVMKLDRLFHQIDLLIKKVKNIEFFCRNPLDKTEPDCTQNMKNDTQFPAPRNNYTTQPPSKKPWFYRKNSRSPFPTPIFPKSAV